MNSATITAVAVLLTVWSLLSGVLARRNRTGPIVFVLVGYALGNPDWGLLPVDAAAESVQLIAEVTLALLLFSDASRVSFAERCAPVVRMAGGAQELCLGRSCATG